MFEQESKRRVKTKKIDDKILNIILNGITIDMKNFLDVKSLIVARSIPRRRELKAILKAVTFSSRYFKSKEKGAPAKQEY